MVVFKVNFHIVNICQQGQVRLGQGVILCLAYLKLFGCGDIFETMELIVILSSVIRKCWIQSTSRICCCVLMLVFGESRIDIGCGGFEDYRGFLWIIVADFHRCLWVGVGVIIHIFTDHCLFFHMIVYLNKFSTRLSILMYLSLKFDTVNKKS